MRYRTQHGVVLLALSFAAAAASSCSDPGASPLAPATQSMTAADGTVDLNPQPEPPSLELDYALTPDGTDWFGTIQVGNQSCGSMQLVQTSSRQSGIVTHVAYALSIQGENPAFGMDADLSGIVVRGRVVLNGKVSGGFYDGQAIHPRGQIVASTDENPIDQLTRMIGTVELNPQPEPPSAAYPPSPCVAE
jgi:hypothetical protein